MQKKDLRLELKAVQDDGSFEGYLSVYDEVDALNDVVDRGAFTKTMQEQKGVVPMLWHHDPTVPLGSMSLQDDETGLKVHGTMLISESPKAREIHAVAKHFQEVGRPMGLSIGYDAIKKAMVDGVRHLKEIRLYEGSMTLFPVCASALISSIKAKVGTEAKADFLTELEMAQLSAMRYLMIGALDSALYSIIWDWDAEFPDAAAKIKASDESIQQFHTSYLEFLPKYLAMRGEKSAAVPETKAGRRISSATRAEIEDAIKKLQGLLDGDDGTSTEAAAAPNPGESKTDKPGAAPAAAPAAPEPENDLHSAFSQIQLKGLSL